MSDFPVRRSTSDLPSALERQEEIRHALSAGRLAFFFDYDGVLTPIVRRPGEAVLSPETRRLLQTLAALCPVAIVSGRDLENVKEMAAVAGITYAGSHGFDLEFSSGLYRPHPEAGGFLPFLDRAERELRRRLASLAGARVERKRFAVAVHFREVAVEDFPAVERTVDSVLDEIGSLRKTGGKKILELRPDLDWDKGEAVLFILESLGLGRTSTYPVYVGDDLTDEDAFCALQGWGLGIIVRDEARLTHAECSLESTEEVERLLTSLIGDLYPSTEGARPK